MPFVYKQTPRAKRSKRYAGADKFRVLYYNRVTESKKRAGPDETVFERCDAPCRPVVSKEKAYKLKWKTSDLPQGEKKDEENQIPLEEMRKTQDFRLAKKIITQLRQNNILETAVKEEDLPVIKQFIRKKMDHATKKIIEIMDDAMEYCYKEVMRHQDRYNVLAEPDVKKLLSDRQKAKQSMLDVLLTHHDFIPVAWGGRGGRNLTTVPSGQPQLTADSKENAAEPDQANEKAVTPAQEKKYEDSLCEETPPSVGDEEEQKIPDQKVACPRKADSRDVQNDETPKLRFQRSRSAESAERSGEHHVLPRSGEKLKSTSKDSREAVKRRSVRIEVRRNSASGEKEDVKRRSGTRRSRSRDIRRRKFARSRMDRKREKETHRRLKSKAATPGAKSRSVSSEGTTSGEVHRSPELPSERTPTSDKEKPAAEPVRGSSSVEKSKERSNES